MSCSKYSSEIRNLKNFKHKSKCFNESNEDNCKFVAHRPAMPFNNWKGLRFCAKRNNYWSRTFDCPKTDHKCSNDICVPGSRICPDNFIAKINDTPENINRIQAEYFNSNKVIF